MGYFPNGTAGEAFYEEHCSRCEHDREWREHERNPCPVWNAHLLYSYELCNEKEHPGKVMLDMLIPKGCGSCAMFVPTADVAREEAERERLQLRLDELRADAVKP